MTDLQSRNRIQEVMVRAAAHAKREESYRQGGFEFICRAGHILESACRHDVNAAFEETACMRCLYQSELRLPELPEMVFPRNALTIKFRGGTIELNALDALKMVCPDKLPDVKVGPSTVWQSARQERLKMITEQHQPFDWTYTTHYKGTVAGCTVEATEEKIDMERLKRRDQIMFHSSVTLFEDELADHGIAQLSARIRVMDAGYFFVLLRFYMRVDNVLLRVCDTRIVGDDNSNFVIREWQLREAKYEQLKHVFPDDLLDIDRAWMHLPVIQSTCEKITANS
ncbi:unnamed protein product [Caenorhabditis bovis]|uniref:TIP41-like protein n=1 Tax=Caenorhabditis bovis TaxID=2654633 RepID=A0A8S1EU41_9PELO|nr:unnamed protein product [Caenorhabditis bovis]